MKKTAVIAGLCLLGSSAFAFTNQQFHNDEANQALRGFAIVSAPAMATRGVGQKVSANSLVLKRAKTFVADTQHYTTSYYQYYHGIRVLDGEITVHESKQLNSGQRAASVKKVVGQLVQDIDISPSELDNFKTEEKLDRALADAKTTFLEKRAGHRWEFKNDQANLVIKEQEGKLALFYEIQFYATAIKKRPVLYHAFLDPQQRNKVIKSWNDMMNYSDAGPGGNTKTSKYHYGVNGLPSLNVSKKHGKCVMKDSSAKLMVVDMSKEDPNSSAYHDFLKPYTYQCQSEARDIIPFFGAYSPADDAYYFGHVVQQAYAEWYQTKVLNLPMITIRVHYRESSFETMDNAFWDGFTNTLNFGDGSTVNNAEILAEGGEIDTSAGSQHGFYPMVSIDFMGHEMSHGFTQAHSNLQYHDEPGCLNEAFSDMAGIFSMAYLREKQPALYNSIYHTSAMTWLIGSALAKNPATNAALRYMDRPPRDGFSAECYKSVPGCVISYEDIQLFAYHLIDDEDDRQGFIVHHGSGIYNKFFYTLANTPGWDIKKAFGLMLKSNRDGYWGENTDFQQAACQTLLAARDLAYDTTAVVTAFNKVGIDTSSCSS